MVVYPVPRITRPAPPPTAVTKAVFLPAAPPPPAAPELPSLVIAPHQPTGWPKL